MGRFADIVNVPNGRCLIVKSPKWEIFDFFVVFWKFLATAFKNVLESVLLQNAIK